MVRLMILAVTDNIIHHFVMRSCNPLAPLPHQPLEGRRSKSRAQSQEP
jgi:hypothetical protein